MSRPGDGAGSEMPVRRIHVGGGIEGRLAEMARGLERGAKVRVGFLAGATYPSGESVAVVAALNEFGHIQRTSEGDYYVLPRPFFRNMIKDKRGEWPGAIRQALVDNGYDAEKALDVVGQGIAGQLKEAIANYDAGPPLAESTIRRKGFSKQLIDSSTMINSVDHEIEGL